MDTERSKQAQLLEKIFYKSSFIFVITKVFYIYIYNCL